ncbi:MAG: hypothetical protein ABW185_10860, partial [Sedimenticola sp.]
MVEEMEDTEIHSKIVGGDLVATEAKYHLSCLTKYRNKYRSYVRAREASPKHAEQLQERKVKARAFAELVGYMKNAVEEDGTYIFVLVDLQSKHDTYLKALGLDITTNKFRLKNEILEHFHSSGIQEQTDRKRTVLVFPEGMQEILHDAVLVRDYKSEALEMVKVATTVRKEIFESSEQFQFSGNFPPACQTTSVPNSLNVLVSMLLNGPNIVHQQDIFSQATSTISQLILFNSKKIMSERHNITRHSIEREPSVVVYLGLNIHSLTRSKRLIKQLSKLGMCISYSRVQQLESNIELNMCKRFAANSVVCPSQLRTGLFVVGAMDNIDHNPSSTTALSSFHGTGISIVQFPTAENNGTPQEPASISAIVSDKLVLPDSYSTVPAVELNTSRTVVPAIDLAQPAQQNSDYLNRAIVIEDTWLQNAVELLATETITDEAVAWAAFHAKNQPPMLDPAAIIALLPLFFEKADTPAMIKHGMNVIRSVTEFLHPGQVPVMACDCPIFAKAKYIQWTWPNSHGEDKFVVMFGGLHLEMALWNMLGDYLKCSGWTMALTDAEIATAGTAEGFLKAAHLTRTRHAHQVSIVALSALQQRAFLLTTGSNEDGDTFETWRKRMITTSPTFQFWDTIIRIEKMVLVLLRAHRENNFDLYLEALEWLVGFFFALDHYNYARWISVHIRDMKSLPSAIEDEFKKHWVVPKTTNRFSSLPIDQIHEQENAKVKGKGGAIGLTEDPVSLRRWLVCGPELANLMGEFDDQYMLEDNRENNLHHAEGLATQKLFHQQSQNLTDVIAGFGNPFEDDCPELLVLNSRVCADNSIVETVRTIEYLGRTQYQQYVNDVIETRDTPIQNPIKKNLLPLLKSPKSKTISKSKNAVQVQRQNSSLFGRLYIANQQRDGDP